MEARFIDKISLIVGSATLLVSFVIFFQNTKEFWGSLVAATMTGALIWLTYVILRWLLLANRN